MYNHLYGPRVGGDQGYGSNRVSGREIYKDMDLDSLAEKLARNPQRLTLEERMAAIWHPQVVHGPVHKTANLGQNPQRYYDMRGATRMDPTVGGYHPSGFGGTAVAPDPYPSVPGSASYGAYGPPGSSGFAHAGPGPYGPESYVRSIGGPGQQQHHYLGAAGLGAGAVGGAAFADHEFHKQGHSHEHHEPNHPHHHEAHHDSHLGVGAGASTGGYRFEHQRAGHHETHSHPHHLASTLERDVQKLEHHGQGSGTFHGSQHTGQTAGPSTGGYRFEHQREGPHDTHSHPHHLASTLERDVKKLEHHGQGSGTFHGSQHAGAAHHAQGQPGAVSHFFHSK
eukprot:TRINITY_DN1021_c0_g1_i2.p1 TRINITY_DN1021_c0_g1~~TRINITY_DN1021_c0_g1_i2.p1  ORF type:complete len:346 (-),score=33.67 TRINITY_DN1021_c0_g1_i2:293-1306(-)